MSGVAVKDRILADLELLADLPARSDVLGPLMAALGRDDVGFGAVEQLVARDPVIAARVISAANAAAYAGYMPVTSLGPALMRLGLARVHRLALLASLYNFAPTSPEYHDAFWRHSLAVSQAVESVLREVGTPPGVDPAQLGVAGLMHDLGLLVLAAHFPKQDAAIGAATRADDAPRWVTEERVLGIDHAAISAALLEHWRIPRAISEPVRYHHHPDGAPAEHRLAAAILRIADAAAMPEPILALGSHGDVSGDERAVAELGLDAGRLASLVETARDESLAVVTPAHFTP